MGQPENIEEKSLGRASPLIIYTKKRESLLFVKKESKKVYIRIAIQRVYQTLVIYLSEHI